MKAKGFSLMSGGLDSQLAVKVLQRAGAHVEGICFSSPFFSSQTAERSAKALGIELHVIDFTDDAVSLIENPKHGFGGAMNPCIDCHALMIHRAGELMVERGFDFVATGEVMGQRPMSQNRQSLGVVERDSGLKGRLVRPLSAKLLEPTIPEMEGLLDRDALLDIQGRQRDRQIALAAEFGIEEYPSPAGGCKLTEEGFCRKLKDLKDHESLLNRRLLELLGTGRRFRFPSGMGVVLGRDRLDNERLKRESDLGVVLSPVNCPGPTAILTGPVSGSDLTLAAELVCAYSKCDRLAEDVIVQIGREKVRRSIPGPYQRDKFKEFQIC